MNTLQGQKRLNAWPVFVMLSVIFFAAQLIFFLIHYHVSELMHSLAGTSVSLDFWHLTVAVPVFLFFLLQLSACVLSVVFIRFISVSVEEFFDLGDAAAYGLLLLNGFFGAFFILSLNSCLYPGSFFAFAGISHVGWAGASGMVLLAQAFISGINTLRTGRHLWAAVLFVLLAVGAVADSFQPLNTVALNTTQKPNVIVIGLDSVRPDFVGFYTEGAVSTPNIDRLLSGGTVFANAYSPLARTFPAWVGILTAKYPLHSGARTNLSQIHSGFLNQTLAKKLRENGWFTVYGTDEPRYTDITKEYGFDRIVGPKGGAAEIFIAAFSDFPLTNLLVNLPVGRSIFPYNYANRGQEITYNPDHFLQQIRRGLAGRPDKPLFLAVHLCLPHWPYGWAGHAADTSKTPADYYRSAIEGVDVQLGGLMKMLKTAGLLQNARVILLSDHGTSLGLKGDRMLDGKKYDGDPEKLRMVMVYKYAGAPEFSSDFKHDYSMATSWGVGTDLASFRRQNHVLLASIVFPRRKSSVKTVTALTSLLDIAPSILSDLKISPLAGADGLAWSALKPHDFFMETGESLAEIETDHIYIEKVLKQQIGIYRIDPESGRLYISAKAADSINKNKQYAVLHGDWLLVHYPLRMQPRLVMIKGKGSVMQMAIKVFPVKPYFILANLRTGRWTIEMPPFSESSVKNTPLLKTKAELDQFFSEIF